MAGADHVASLEDHLGYWLRFVSNHVSHAFERKVAAHGVTVAEWVAMRGLFETREVNPSRLAEQLGMTRGAISKLVDRLAAKGHVECRVENQDRRFVTVMLTPSGRKLVPKLAALADANDREFFGRISEKQQQDLMGILREIVAGHGLKQVPVD